MSAVKIPRVAVAFLYGLYIALGAVAIILGIPTFDLTAPAGGAVLWGGATSILASLGLYAVLAQKRRTERVASGLISLSLSFYLLAALYLIATGDNSAGRGAFAVVLMIMMWFPVVQFMSLRKGAPQ